jgi:hypothetical protein
LSNKEGLEEVYRAAGEMEAQVVKSLLESYDIPCLLQPDNLLPSPYSPVMNIGNISILVKEAAAGQARQLIGSNNDV